MIKTILKVLGTLFLIGITTCAILGCFAATYIQTVILPQDTVDATAYSMNLSSTIYYTDPDTGAAVELRTLYGEENRVLVDYDEIPADLINALVAIEDQRFWTHDGVDWKRTAGAFLNMFLGMRDTYGGSTITQQLIKNMTQNDEVTVKRKILEIFRALEFERNYSKEDILVMYLNHIYLGEGCYGVGTAALTYFGKPVSELSLAECASLIGITNNPSRYDPYISDYTRSENKRRQETILYEMLDQGYITQPQYDAAVAEELVFAGGEQGATSTSAYSYFEDQLILDVISDLQETYGWSRVYASQMVYNGGLTIYCTQDPNIQAKVDAVYEDLSNFDAPSSSGQQLQSAITVIDNATGNVVALAGGVGEKTGSLLTNRATQSLRQPGSAIKPIAVYAPALDLGVITPATVIDDSPYSFDGEGGSAWPVNAVGYYRGLTDVYTAVEDSINTVAVKVLGYYTSPQVAFDFLMNNLGFSTEHLVVQEEINGTPYSDIGLAQMALGGLTNGITTLEMAAAYAAFPRGGLYIEPRTYTRVEQVDQHTGVVTVLLDNVQESHAAMKDSTAWYINTMLRSVISSGTGTRASFSGMTIAGKTGTTSARRDLYFVGYSPYYTAAVWSGYDTPERMSSSLQQTSANTWRMVMSSIHEGLENRSFPEPSAGLVTTSVCADSGLRPTDACVNDVRGDRTVSMTFVRGGEPTESCNVHVEQEICSAAPILDANGASNGMYYLAGEFCPEDTRRMVGIPNLTREGAAAAVNVRDSQYTTGYLESLGDAAYCSVHTTAPEPEPSAPLVIDPYDPATWPGPEAFATIEDFNRFNPFDQSTWPEGAVSVSEEPPAASTPGLPTEPPALETPVTTPLPSEAVSPSSPPAVVTPPVFSEEPFLPAA